MRTAVNRQVCRELGETTSRSGLQQAETSERYIFRNNERYGVKSNIKYQNQRGIEGYILYPLVHKSGNLLRMIMFNTSEYKFTIYVYLLPYTDPYNK